MFNKNKWSIKKFSWFYAVVIALLTAVGSFLFVRFEIVEVTNLRVIYVFVILFGIMGFSWDVAKHSEVPISFRDTFKHCFRTGVFMCAILLSIVLIALFSTSKIDVLEQGILSGRSARIGFSFSVVIEIFATILISSFVAAFIPGMIKKRK